MWPESVVIVKVEVNISIQLCILILFPDCGFWDSTTRTIRMEISLNCYTIHHLKHPSKHLNKILLGPWRCVVPCVATYYGDIMHCYSYSKIYMKAIAHHIPKEQWAAILEVKYYTSICYSTVQWYTMQGIYSQLTPGGMLLVDTGGDTCTLPWGVRATKEYNRLVSGLLRSITG